MAEIKRLTLEEHEREILKLELLAQCAVSINIDGILTRIEEEEKIIELTKDPLPEWAAEATAGLHRTKILCNDLKPFHRQVMLMKEEAAAEAREKKAKKSED